MIFSGGVKKDQRKSGERKRERETVGRKEKEEEERQEQVEAMKEG